MFVVNIVTAHTYKKGDTRKRITYIPPYHITPSLFSSFSFPRTFYHQIRRYPRRFCPFFFFKTRRRFAHVLSSPVTPLNYLDISVLCTTFLCTAERFNPFSQPPYEIYLRDLSGLKMGFQTSKHRHLTTRATAADVRKTYTHHPGTFSGSSHLNDTSLYTEPAAQLPYCGVTPFRQM